MVARPEIGSALRVVLDTNVVLSALLFRAGRVRRVFDGVESGRIIPLVSKETAGELVRVLAYPKFKLTPQERRTALEVFLHYAEVVGVNGVKSVPACRDPDDKPFLKLAAEGKADFLVTGDRDLLDIKGDLPCPIITPEQLLEAVSPKAT